MVERENSSEHDALVRELINLENTPPEERLALAKERRQKQLDAYEHRLHTPSWISNEKVDHASHGKRIRFDSNIELIEAAARDDAEEVGYFLHNGVSPNLQNEDGLSALHQAVIEDCEDVVDVLIKFGADLNIKDADLWTPLHAAVACGNYHLVKYLVEKGASLIEINTDGNMPIDLVDDNVDIEVYLDQAMADAGYTEELLENVRNEIANEMIHDLKDSVENDRDLNIVGEHGETAMHVAAANGYCSVVEFLLDHGAKVDVVDNDHWQPIHAAACWGQDKIIEVLVHNGADLDARTKDGETPIDLTEDEDLQGMIIELKESGHKTKELKRSQSNSSRTLSVRRSSIVEKRQKSLNDAKQEGIQYRQNPDFLHVDIKTDDGDDSSFDPRDIQQNVAEINSFSEIKEKESNTSENHVQIDNISSGNATVAFKQKQEDLRLDLENSNSATVSLDNLSSQKNNEVSAVAIDIKSIDMEEEKPTANNSSHNTAKKASNKLTQSTESAVKKKCCVIL